MLYIISNWRIRNDKIYIVFIIYDSKDINSINKRLKDIKNNSKNIKRFNLNHSLRSEVYFYKKIKTFENSIINEQKKN